MNEKEKSSLQLLANILLIILISTFETSLWPRLFSPIPNPQLWLSVVVFVFLYQSKIESLLIVYLPAIFIFLLTTQPLGFILLAETLLFFIIIFIKNRIFIPGAFYYSVIYSFSVLIFQALLFSFSWIFDMHTETYPQVWKWFAQAILAFSVSPILYSILAKLNPVDEHSVSEGGSL